jgi:hypothetical protein
VPSGDHAGEKYIPLPKGDSTSTLNGWGVSDRVGGKLNPHPLMISIPATTIKPTIEREITVFLI